MTRRPQPRQYRARPFNMVEIALALAVVGIALLAVTSLIPIGARATAEATGQHYATDGADQVLQWLSYYLQDDALWDQFVADASPVIPDDPPDISSINTNPDSVSWTDVPTTNGLFYHDFSGKRVYRLLQRDHQDNIQQDVIVRIWKSTTSCTVWNGSNWTTVTDTNHDSRVQLNIELCWPAQLPYRSRDKAHFAMEVAR